MPQLAFRLCVRPRADAATRSASVDPPIEPAARPVATSIEFNACTVEGPDDLPLARAHTKVDVWYRKCQYTVVVTMEQRDRRLLKSSARPLASGDAAARLRKSLRAFASTSHDDRLLAAGRISEPDSYCLERTLAPPSHSVNTWR